MPTVTLTPPPPIALAARARSKQFKERSLASDLLAITAWTSGAAAGALFLAAGGAGQFTSIAQSLSSLGIIAGLIGSDLVLVMLVLAARLRVIDRAVGHDRAMALHRSLGKPALYLLLAHGVLLWLGYAATDGVDVVDELVLLWNVPDMPLAFIGLGLFIAVVVSSLVAVKRRFPYEVWHGIHLLSYAAVLAAIPHQLSVGGILADGSFQEAYWVTLLVASLGSIVVFRFLVPAYRSIKHGIVVSNVERIADGVVNVHLAGRGLRSLRSAGGQFIVWRFWTGTTWWHSHPISLSTVPTDTHARITVRALGDGTTRLGELPRGTRVSFEGPYGLFTDAARTAPKLAIVAAGIGVTPVRALIEDSVLAPGEATVLLRASDDSERFLWDELRELAEAKGITFYTSIGHRGSGRSRWLAAEDAARGVTLRSVFPDLSRSDLYVCGPQVWTDQVIDEAKATGMPAHQLHTERFDW